MHHKYFDLISENWFLSEPAFFSLYCTQQLHPNVHMECPLRCGKGRVEYNPLLLEHKNYHEVEELLRIEMIRLFLKHPFDRHPDGCTLEAMALGSDCAIEDGYCIHNVKLPLKGPRYYNLPLGETYEFYAKHIQGEKDKGKENNEQNNPDNKENNQGENSQANSAINETSQKAELWEDDAVGREQVNRIIESTTDWGSIPANIVEKIKASTQARINNSYIMQGFRSSIVSSHRQLTRMKPNRRTGFLQMGNTRQYDASLLIAVDVSGSVSTEQLADFYSAINRIFRFGIAQIDCVQFDSIPGEVTQLKHASAEITVKGRGGTNYQPVIDLALTAKQKYDGLIIFTDGQAPTPEIPAHFPLKMLWVCCNRQAYEAHSTWMKQSGRVCYL